MNNDQFRSLCSTLKEKKVQVRLGGGKVKIQKQHAKGKLTARERIAYLTDDDMPFTEIGTFAGEGMYDEYGGCPSGGVVTGIGYVSGRQCVIVANDATVKAGAWFPITAKKNLRAQEIAMDNRLPVIYLVDSAGVFLPLQDEIFPDKEHFGRQFRNNAKMSSMGIVQIAAIMGSCVAGGAYLPIMSDEALIVEKTGTIYLAGPYLVKAAIGESVDNDTLGGATTHCEISGVTDNKFESDEACLDYIRSVMGKIATPRLAGFSRAESKFPARKTEDIYNIMPIDPVKPYDMREVLDCLADEGSIDEYKPLYGKTLICAYARIDGWAVGVVANQRKTVKTKKGEMRMGGVIYSDSADKATRFIMNCNQRKIPLVFFQDVTGFMVGTKAEHGGIIKDGAKMVNAVANSTVPKFTIIVGNSYGAGNYAMCGKAYDPRMIFAWPTARMAVMSGASAASTLLQIKVAGLEVKGETIDEKSKNELLQEITNRYNERLGPYYAAARLWVDDVIMPEETRLAISEGIKAANQGKIKKFNVGVIQT
ncbi:MAG: acyl-CoA carboxylase subunit beta [Cyclobacteriaceae bacterium]|nr:acyl-CoA carboxylase subunit beta [Cyclobacteriaceae bacterium]